jgi:hypothetical protein
MIPSLPKIAVVEEGAEEGAPTPPPILDLKYEVNTQMIDR